MATATIGAVKGTVGALVLERVLRDFDAVVARLPEQIASRAARRAAAEQLARLGWPTVRDELWRYAHLRAFERIGSFTPAAATAATDAELALPPALPGFRRIVFVDGIRHPGIGRDDIGRDRAAIDLQRPGGWTESAWTAAQRLGLLADMFAPDAAVLHVADEAAIELLFLVTARAAGAAVYPRLQVQLAPNARLTLIERHAGSAAALVAGNCLIDLAAGAQLRHYRLQHYGHDVLFSDTLAARVQAQAGYWVRQIGIGAGSTRTSAVVRLAGANAALDWQAIAIGRGEQNHDTALEVEHLAPATRTTEVFRGIADERARLAFHGHVHVGAAAPGAEARQSLRGLIEGASAEIDLRPRMQIDTDEVSAQHGATTGQLDEALLFYLLSRGIDRGTARALLKWAFLGDVLRAIELPALRAEAERGAAGQLQDVLALGAVPAGERPASSGAAAAAAEAR